MAIAQDSIPLWRKLSATSEVVRAVRAGGSGTAAIEAVSAEIRPAVQALAFQVWRNLGRAQALCRLLAKKRPPQAVDTLLCIGLALVWCEDESPYESFTLVNQIVETAKRKKDTRAQANFVNACLRKFLRERESLVESTDSDPVAFWNFPEWWIDRVANQYPAQWEDILRASNSPGPMTLRVNCRRCNGAQFGAALEEHGIEFDVDFQGAFVLRSPVPVQRIPGFAAGWFSVQDSGAQLAAPLLLAELQKEGRLRILDACAAPGGKTGHLLELVEAEVVAIEKDHVRSMRIHQNLSRLGLTARVLNADAADTQTWWDGRQFDAILADAPCTASGIVRRHPDVRWLRRESDIAKLADLQRKILNALWKVLRPGGVMLYCTCSLFKEEGEQQVQTFLAYNKDACLLPSPGHLLPGSATKHERLQDNVIRDHDGFFYALLEKCCS